MSNDAGAGGFLPGDNASLAALAKAVQECQGRDGRPGADAYADLVDDLRVAASSLPDS